MMYGVFYNPLNFIPYCFWFLRFCYLALVCSCSYLYSMFCFGNIKISMIRTAFPRNKGWIYLFIKLIHILIASKVIIKPFKNWCKVEIAPDLDFVPNTCFWIEWMNEWLPFSNQEGLIGKVYPRYYIDVL